MSPVNRNREEPGDWVDVGVTLLEGLVEIEELFVYVLLPLAAIAAVYVVGVGLYQSMLSPATSDAALLSIDPSKWS